MAFVTTSAPAGWKLGRWTQTSQKAWQETKLDDAKISYQFQAVDGPASPTNSVRLKMQGQNTEVLLLESTAVIFVNGSYLGEYGGQWEAAPKGSKQPAAAPAQAGRAAAPAAPAAAAQAGRAAPPPPQPPAKGEEFEKTLAPPSQAPQKSAPPPRSQGSSKQAAPAPAPAVQAAPRIQSSPAPAFQSASDIPRKAEGLDKSDGAMQKLIAAAKNGDTKQVNELLAAGTDPDGPAKDGRTPLMAAAGGGHLAVVEALLAACADPNLGKGSETPMTIAFEKGKQDVLKALFGASFSNLDGMINSGCGADIPDVGGSRANQEVPDNAERELKELTTMIAKQSMKRPESPEAHKKYGNYAGMEGTDEFSMSDKDSEMMRTEAVKYAMRTLSRNTKDSGLAVDQPIH